MKTLIAYSASHNCTERITLQMKDYLGGDVTIVNLRKQHDPSLKEFNRVIIGGSVRAGQVHKCVKDFCATWQSQLLQKELGLFICSMETGEVARKQLEEAFPCELRDAAKVTTFFGGTFDFTKMNFLERMIVRKVPQIRKSTSKVDFEAVKRFSMRMDRIFNPFLFLA
jgi:menaquinone-dependent protoporphyrinogen oxidase